jgi:hypothetical protein
MHGNDDNAATQMHGNDDNAATPALHG